MKRILITSAAALALLSPMATSAVDLAPLAFEARIEGHDADPLEIWSDDEIAQSQVYTKQWISVSRATVPSGELVISVLFGDLCSMSECPFRVDLVDNGNSQPILPPTREPFDFEMACQTLSQYFVAVDGSYFEACGAQYPLDIPS